MRDTRNKTAILKVLRERGAPMSTSQIKAKLKWMPEGSISSSLSSLKDMGKVFATRREDGGRGFLWKARGVPWKKMSAARHTSNPQRREGQPTFASKTLGTTASTYAGAFSHGAGPAREGGAMKVRVTGREGRNVEFEINGPQELRDVMDAIMGGERRVATKTEAAIVTDESRMYDRLTDGGKKLIDVLKDEPEGLTWDELMESCEFASRTDGMHAIRSIQSTVQRDGYNKDKVLYKNVPGNKWHLDVELAKAIGLIG